jgi:hypothetical protein
MEKPAKTSRSNNAGLASLGNMIPPDFRSAAGVIGFFLAMTFANLLFRAFIRLALEFIRVLAAAFNFFTHSSPPEIKRK